MEKVLKEVISLLIKEEISKSVLEKQPSITVPVKLYLEPDPVDELGTETVATVDNKVYRLSKSYNAGNALVDDLVMNFSKEINDSRPLNMSREDMRSFLLDKKMELESLLADRSGTDMALLNTEARNIASDIRNELEQNLYNVPAFLKSAGSIEELIRKLEETYDLKSSERG